MLPEKDATPTYLEIGRRKREERQSRIPSEWQIKGTIESGLDVRDVPAKCGILTIRELEMTSDNDAVDLVAKIRSRKYSAVEVTVAFCKRAAIAQQLTNCLTEMFFEEAIQRARELDEEQANSPDGPLRPLHGLPISLKDAFKIPGRDSTTGIVCWAFQPDEEYSFLPAMLLDLGAVLYCKTNTPQTMMTADSDNNLFGRTLNPANSNLTAGGSSGGEGALIAMRGSVLGIGSDIAGSIRIPSLCNGIYGLRPSADIVPYGGQRHVTPPGMCGIAAVAGPMATTLRSCSYFMKTIIEAQPWRYDPCSLHLSWIGHEATRELRIGIAFEDGAFTPWPPVRRTMQGTAKQLTRAGVEVIPIHLPDVHEALGTAFRMFALDGCKFIQDRLLESGEPEIESVRRVNLAGIPGATLDELFEMNAVRERIQAIYHRLWLDNRLDALILPSAATTATPIDEWGPVTYTALWNFLDYPAVILPTGRVQPGDEADSLENARHGDMDRKNYSLCESSI
ncbi:Putative amidase [Fulvia fulva]|uniref:amidase n=1 Tax=Passalora fulva TaxID=5499 RepID=A0A9Q8LJD1_PASFU|nr:Putative amidase [Fulvia fulva]KAK4621497.1 putative amidase [Fulvia fulva]KAK4623484.1 putative amidase [Fulvia fulva]UJO18460.1 Putative amidase [Fulvia fulva]WPV15718.1 Putative amidase [Fulvia fulva]WPV31740.1 Putative amidase [Fulvia fulva]